MTSVYRKKTFAGLYTKWDSFTPRKYKINLISTLTYRCFRICSSASLLHSAIQDLRTFSLQNGYPQGIITYNVNDVLNRHKNKPDTPVATVPNKRHAMHAEAMTFHKGSLIIFRTFAKKLG